MNQDDVDLIYDYLHNNYRYEEGDLYRTVGSNGHPVGEKLGTFSHNEKWSAPAVKSVLVINKRRFPSMLAHIIWIYHYKKKPAFIEFIDGSVVNTRIENLKEIDAIQQYLKKTVNSKGVFKIKNNTGIVWRALINCNNKSIFLGHHDTKKDAEKAYKWAREAVGTGIYEPLEIKKYVNYCLGYNKISINKNKNGFKGVKKTKSGTYYGYSVRKGHKIQTKAFKTPEEAHEAYLATKKIDWDNQ